MVAGIHGVFVRAAVSYTVECNRCHVSIVTVDAKFHDEWAEITDSHNNIAVSYEEDKRVHLCGECTNKLNKFLEG